MIKASKYDMSRPSTPVRAADDETLLRTMGGRSSDAKRTRGVVRLGEIIGSGAEGIVFLASWVSERGEQALSDEIPCAVKYVGPNQQLLHEGLIFEPDQFQSTDDEGEPSLHSKIARSISSSAESGILNQICELEITKAHQEKPNAPPAGRYFVLPLCPARLRDAIQPIVALKENNPVLHERVLFEFVDSMVSALSTLMKSEVFHCDVKPENIGCRPLMLQKDDGARTLIFRWCLYDFGMAKRLDSPEMRTQGTPLYMAPEVVTEAADTSKRDIWAFGQILRELLGECLLFHSPDGENAPVQVLFRIFTAFNEAVPATTQSDQSESWEVKISSSTTFFELLKVIAEAMSQINPEKRIDLHGLTAARNKLEILLSSAVDANAVKSFYCGLSNIGTAVSASASAIPNSPCRYAMFAEQRTTSYSSFGEEQCRRSAP